MLAFAVLLHVLPRVLASSPMTLRVISSALLLAILVAAPTLLTRLSLFTAVHFAIAAGYLVAALIRIPFAMGSTPFVTVVAGKAYDYICGGILISLCLALSATEFMKHVQNRALLSDAFNQGVQYNRLAKLLIK